MRNLDELRRRIDSDPALREILREVEARLSRGSDAAHDLGHTLRVALWTCRLGGEAVDARRAIAAALLHDVVGYPKDSAGAARSSVESAELAGELLRGSAFSEEAIAEIEAAIRDHSFSLGAVPDSELGRTLQDADRLDALGAIGTFRAIACGVGLGSVLFDADDPWAERRELDERRFTLDHFFTKLLRLPETFHTAAGRREAERRAEFIRGCLTQLGDELGVPL